MIAWINFSIVIFSSLLMLYFYIRSASPATAEKVAGSTAYARCTRDRIIASIFETVILVNCIVYYFYPLPVPLPERFPWSWWISILIAIVICIPAAALMFKGMRDAGEETLRPKKEHVMYQGIYKKIRHPQALGEYFVWWVIAFLLNSPFLFLLSFIYIPIFIMMCFAEEQDLIWRYGDSYVEYMKNTPAFFPKKG